MLQAFVQLKQQQPPKTASGIRSFFEALTNAVFSEPTVYRSSADVASKPFSLDAVCEASLDSRCKFIVLRGESGKFWQCTCLLPDAQGHGALFFDFQRDQNDRISSDELIDFSKRLYKALTPLVIRIGDSEAREKLKSRHGLVFMPRLGRIEWLQVIRPEIYSNVYSVSELAAAPAFDAAVWDDGAFFLRVYGEPDDWESEENVSLANFIPGFLAGIAKIEDGNKEREMVRELEKIWARTEKTAQNAMIAMNGGQPVQPAAEEDSAKEAPAAEEAPKKEEAPSASSVAVDDEERKMRDMLLKRLSAEHKVDDSCFAKVGTEGPCTVFSVTLKGKIEFYASYQDLERKVYILNDSEDFAKFLQANDCNVKKEDADKIIRLTKSYFKPEIRILNSVSDLPKEVSGDRRLSELSDMKASGTIEEVNGTQILSVWIYNERTRALELLKVCQFETWAPTVELEKRIPELELKAAAEEKPAEAKAAAAPAPAKVEEKESVPAKAEEKESVPAKSSNKAVIAIIILIVLCVVVVLLKATGKL